jgi:hypothetical protein
MRKGPGGDLGARMKVELVADVLNVSVNGANREKKPAGDFPIPEAAPYQRRDLELAPAQPGVR